MMAQRVGGVRPQTVALVELGERLSLQPRVGGSDPTFCSAPCHEPRPDRAAFAGLAAAAPRASHESSPRGSSSVSSRWARGRAWRRDREATGTTRLAHPRDAGRRSRAGHEARRAGFPSPLSLLASWAWRAATLAAVPGRGSPRLPGHGTPDRFLRKDILFTAFSVIVSSPCPKFPLRHTCFYSRSRPWPKGKAVPVARRRA